ncbi:MAG: hypothetical protein IT440_13450 [Phycisphaeraceae bacterium]|nr:hypothetical protein [Phycisphaeraceae bacterium]
MKPGMRAILLSATLPALTGCYEQRIVKDSFGEYRTLARESERGEHTDAQGKPSGGGGEAGGDLAEFNPAGQTSIWAIPLESFDGDEQQRRALRLIYRLQRDRNVPDLWQRTEQGKTIVYRGHYVSADAGDAQSDLRQTRMIELDGIRPYQDVEVKRINFVPQAARSQLDLKRYAGQDLYTLQVGAYDDQFKGDPRKAAEDAAEELRKEGELAFYYHGPNMSVVTIGLWDYETAWSREVGVQDRYSEVVLKTQQQHPDNQLNGKPIWQKEGGQTPEKQGSFLVHVPK